MQTLIIYHSGHHHNTQRVASAMAEVLGADLKKVVEADAGLIAGYDLIGFGAGIYFGRHHNSLLNFVRNLPALNKKVFLFSTSGMAGKYFFHKELKRILREKNCTILAEFSCRGFDEFGPLGVFGGVNKGRPNTQDLADARAFAEALKTS